MAKQRNRKQPAVIAFDSAPSGLLRKRHKGNDASRAYDFHRPDIYSRFDHPESDRGIYTTGRGPLVERRTRSLARGI